jgi:hypothetical protein
MSPSINVKEPLRIPMLSLFKLVRERERELVKQLYILIEDRIKKKNISKHT